MEKFTRKQVIDLLTQYREDVVRNTSYNERMEQTECDLDQDNWVNEHIPEKEENPFNVFGHKPSRMNFEDADEFNDRLDQWEIWEEKHNPKK